MTDRLILFISAAWFFVVLGIVLALEPASP